MIAHPFSHLVSLCPAHFEDIVVGQVIALGMAPVDPRSLETFCSTFAPGWAKGDGAPDAFVFAIWSRNWTPTPARAGPRPSGWA